MDLKSLELQLRFEKTELKDNLHHQYLQLYYSNDILMMRRVTATCKRLNVDEYVNVKEIHICARFDFRSGIGADVYGKGIGSQCNPSIWIMRSLTKIKHLEEILNERG